MTGDTIERYEAGSVAWVDALREYATNAAKGKDVDFELTFCAEYRNPPAHLLRDNGRDTIGYVIQIKDGQVRVFDGVRDDFDVRVSVAYDPVALKYSLRGDGEFLSWMTENALRLMQEGKFIVTGDRALNQQLAKVLDLTDFYAKHTL